MSKRGQRMSMRSAMAVVDDDLPDGAYWGLVHEMAGLEYGEGFDELASEADHPEPLCAAQRTKPFKCLCCCKRFASRSALDQHNAATGHTVIACPVCEKKFGEESALKQHTRAKHPEAAPDPYAGQTINGEPFNADGAP